MLFHRDSFIFRESGASVFSYKKGDEFIRLPVYIEKNSLKSLPKSPFGGFDMSENINEDRLESFILAVLKHPDIQKIDKFWLRTYPEIYDIRKAAMVHHILLQHGFIVEYIDVNMHLTTTDSFTQDLQPSEKRYLNLARKGHWRFERLNPELDLTSVYDILLQARAIKKYPISMTFEELSVMFALYPEDYLLFGVRYQEELLAAAVCIRVNHRIIYDFMHGDALRFRENSPIVFLLSGIHTYARGQNIDLVDLGTCSNLGIRNEGLCTFKKNMGGKPSDKKVYVLDYTK